MGAPKTAPSRMVTAGCSTSSIPRSSSREIRRSESNETPSRRTLQLPSRFRWIAPSTRARCSPVAGTTSSVKRVPGGPRRELELANRLWMHRDAPARALWRDVTAVANDNRVEEVLVEVLDVLEDAVFERPADRDVIEQRDVLHVLAKADPAGMWADRHAELGRQEEHRQHLVQAAEAACIQLAEADRLSLEELLEDHAVLTMLAGGHPDRRDGPCDGGVAEHVIGARRLLDPVRLEFGQPPHVGNRVADLPDLIGVHHQVAIGPNLLADDASAPHIVLDPLAHLHLYVRPAGRHGLAAQRAKFLVGVAEPSG